MNSSKAESKSHIVIRRQNYFNFPTPPPPPGLFDQPCTSRCPNPTVFLYFEGGVGPPARALVWQHKAIVNSEYDLENGPNDFPEILHAALTWWYKNKSLLPFCPEKSFCWPKTLFLGPKMAIFQLFQIWRPIAKRALPGAKKRRTQKLPALNELYVEVLVRFLAAIVFEKFGVFCAFFGFSGSVSADFRHFFENYLHRGQPLAKFFTGQTIWHVSRVFSFLGYVVQK